MVKDANRHCWQCRQRRLVCDFTKPACKRCSNAGLACTGYGNVRPVGLKWLAPGRVLSQYHQRKQKKVGSIGTTERQHSITDIGKPNSSALSDIMVIPPSLIQDHDRSPLAQAAEYYNACMYKDFVPILELVQYPYIHQVWPSGLRKSLRLYPKYLQWGLACVTINHQMHRLETQDSSHFKALAKKFYEYRGIALCSLNEQLTELSLVDQRTSDMVLAGILTLLLIDIHHDTSTGWRNHLVGLQQLLTLRGGLEQLARSENLAPLLLCFWFISVISNTTCPASDLVATGWHLAKSNVVLERYRSNVGIFQLCPPALFTTIIELSHLRLRVTQQAQSSTGAENLADEGYDILNRVHSFSPEHWARSKPSLPEDWILIATIYQCSIALYCVSSLQSLSVFPSTLELRAVCAAHGRTLRSRLSVGLASPKTSRFLLWPLVLLGVEAVHGDAEMRAFVVAQLQLLSRDVGTFIPIAAKNVLESFWDSGDTRWDACFDRAYAFTTHIAVDNSRIAC